ncbi:MAG: Conserved repeat protein [Amycolatopsis sp.]|uniref:DUF7507 domain-containing protein n=1 Tax=Amycolatopsis sp. TaxID=37632 RepID=UPI00260D2131|nr:hypothetical protein [Amycolatopsis sp.]MCU1681711.1 Conserved repeat protein [Amycolatopsis sp.]
MVGTGKASRLLLAVAIMFGSVVLLPGSAAGATVINPLLTIQNDGSPSVVRQGDQITFTITVTNAGDVPLTDVAVGDDTTPGCAKPLGTLAPKEQRLYTCTTTAPAGDFTNTATATGTDPARRVVKVTGDAAVDLIHPAVSITKDATPTVVRQGDTVTFSITVTNSGDVPLTDVAVADDRTPACAKSLQMILTQDRRTYTCTTVAGADGFTNTATVTGTDPTKRPVNAHDDATFTVQHPAVTIVKNVRGGPFRAGDQVPFTITVINSGDVQLIGVKVADEVTADCARTYDAMLAPQGIWAFDCVGRAPADDFTNTATATGNPPLGPPVSNTSVVPVVVIHPGTTIQKDASPTVLPLGRRSVK